MRADSADSSAPGGEAPDQAAEKSELTSDASDESSQGELAPGAAAEAARLAQRQADAVSLDPPARQRLRAAARIAALALVLPFALVGLAAEKLLKRRSEGLRGRAAQELEWLELAQRLRKLDREQVGPALRRAAGRDPAMAAAWFERACLGQGAELAPGDRVPVTPAAAREYLSALVAAGRLDEYGELATAARPSLPQLLERLRAALEGADAPLDPGSSPARPLHIALASIGATGAAELSERQPQGALAALRHFFGAVLTGVVMMAVMAAVVTLGSRIVQRGEYDKDALPEKSVKSFKDVKGCDEAIDDLREIVEYLRLPEKFTKLGGKLPKGVLLTGPPGTGKTLLARAVAGEAGVPFFYNEFDEMFVGVGSRRVRSLFAAAKARSPCIIFIDELDSVGGKRTSWESQTGGSRKTLNQLLTEMDGFEENSGVVVMAATNLPELLDPALTRPGRFDRQVAVPLPDVTGREGILRLYFRDKPLAPDVDVEGLARRTPGFSGAQLANLVNEAALLAARHGRAAPDARARRLTAYHEGGHALVALRTPGARPIHKATIVPRGHALGMVSQVPDRDEYSTTKRQLLAQIDVCMGGRAAEELVFGADSVTTGATSDLRAATATARHMVEDCGMSELVGPVALDAGRGEGRGPGPAARQAVDSEVEAILKASYERVRALLAADEAALHALAQTLLERETLTQDQIRDVVDATAPKEFRIRDESAAEPASGAVDETVPKAPRDSGARRFGAPTRLLGRRGERPRQQEEQTA
ncbi:hypothetical protein QBZ16_001144 [Prototheca wickerhamii]|uniref:AAA+ ATPase domain-containing protein n=1 Tax=Prototheca wickerhamii TaxID=3111 RepID=A0AAD9IHG8_PROWI|nr:hypothetical protein QBZ16_001144 [Prototheca wickerhamii]